MGCCQSNEIHDGKVRNEEIENQLKRDKLNMRNEVKMLLLGNKWRFPNVPKKRDCNETQ